MGFSGAGPGGLCASPKLRRLFPTQLRVLPRALYESAFSSPFQELVKLITEKQEHPSPTSPVKPSLPACKSDR